MVDSVWIRLRRLNQKKFMGYDGLNEIKGRGGRMKKRIQIHNLKKSYQDRVVLKGLDFSVYQGEVFALLGINGAGKTTTLECMEGLRDYDSGSVDIDGRIGIQLQSASLPEHIKAMEAVVLFSKWNHTKADQSMISALGIDAFADKQYYQLSTGQKRRLHLALALLSSPDIIFLDEPTAGLDVEGRTALHEQIRKLKAAGKTILLASHDMAEVESLCDRIAILSEGRIAFIGTAWELNERVGKHYDIVIRTDEGTQNYESDNIGETLLNLLAQYKEAGAVITDIQVNRGSLEQHFMRIAKGE